MTDHPSSSRSQSNAKLADEIAAIPLNPKAFSWPQTEMFCVSETARAQIVAALRAHSDAVGPGKALENLIHRLRAPLYAQRDESGRLMMEPESTQATMDEAAGVLARMISTPVPSPEREAVREVCLCLASVNLTQEAAERQASRMADGLMKILTRPAPVAWVSKRTLERLHADEEALEAINNATLYRQDRGSEVAPERVALYASDIKPVPAASPASTQALERAARAIYDVSKAAIEPGLGLKLCPFEELPERDMKLHMDYARAALAMEAK